MIMKIKSIYIAAIVIGVHTLIGCSTTRHLAENEKLYTGVEIRIESDKRIPGERALSNQLHEVIRPTPNTKFLGLFRHRLWFYNLAGEDAQRGLRGWIKNRLGQPPVLLERTNPENTSVLMVNRLQNEGYFNAEVAYEERKRKRTANILYIVYPNHPYRLKNIYFPEPDTELNTHIREIQEETILREEEIFKLSTLREERERIDVKLKNRGFYYFNSDYIRFRADSTIGDHKVNLYLTVREDAPERAFRRYRIGSIYVYPDHTLDRDGTIAVSDTVHIRNTFFIQHENRFRPDMLAGMIFIAPGEFYNRQDHVLTINRLMGLGTFRFVNMRFLEIEEADEPTLDAHVYLTPVNERSLRAEFRAVSKSNDLAGPGVSVGYRNRNLLRGAELFTLDLTSSFETQLGGGQRGLDLYQIGLESELQIPRIIAPVPIYARTSLYVPRTRIKVGYDILDRIDYLRINSFSTRFGYIWVSGRHVRQEFNPIGINYFRSTIISPDLENLITVNPSLRRSLEPQFIIGTTYSLFFNNQTDDRRRNHIYFNVNLDLSGNSLQAVQSLFRSEEATEDQPYTLFGIPYSQYARADIDVRNYLRTGKKSQIVTRLIAGAGIPYGNSRSMPYVKQFFSGGPNSVRAFPARFIGPGTYPPPDTGDGFLIDRTGDVRVETNIEYRFPIVSILRGALFLDAGNIWMIRENGEREGTTFNFDTFLGELAVGTGFGLRLDVSFFVLRFDVAFPLRIPYLPDGERWVLDEIKFGSSQWRRDNLTFNIAIGYPF
jgi:outer membrane protein insertion porin family